MKRLLGLKFGSSRRLTLHGFALGSAAEVLDDDAGEEGYGVEVGFSFGDGYDFCAAAAEASVEAISNKAAAVIAVEIDIIEVGSDGGIVGEDKVA
jgi:hypothetical protein